MHPAYGGRLEVNLQCPYWVGDLADIAANAQAARARGAWATADVRHPILHELGHLAHWEAKRTSWDDDWGDRDGPAPAQQALSVLVSRRAAHSPAEFVAEVFAGLRLGEAYAPEILVLYQAYGGMSS
jgi:hypothetical protein